MRLKSATIRKYRVHNETQMEFDPRITLICGPNESGKSTLVEAIHRGLFFRSRAGGGMLDVMRSQWGEPPEVDLAFSSQGADCRVRKVFRGPRGECWLSLQGEGTLTGDAAEDRLAKLLGTDGPIEGRGAENLLRRRWAHLWVWQGTSGTDPADSAVEQNQALLRRLQAQGGSAVMQSELDSRVLRETKARRDATFVSSGKFKAGSDVAKAEEILASARLEVQAKLGVLADLQEASDRFRLAAFSIATKTETLRAAAADLQEAETKLHRAEEVERQMEPLTRQIEELAQKIEGIRAVDTSLVATRGKRDEIQAGLTPVEATLQALEMEVDARRRVMKAAESACEDARIAVSLANQRRQVMTEQVSALEKKQQVKKLKAVLAAIEKKRDERQKLTEEMAKVPSVADKDIAALRKIEGDLTTAEAKLSTLGATIEVLKSTVPVSVNGKAVKAGATRLVTDDAEVGIGTQTRLRIRLGGETGLKEAREDLQQALAKRTERLTKLAVNSFDEAVAARDKSREMGSRLDVLNGELNAMGDESIDEDVRSAQQECDECSRRANFAAQQAEIELPADLARAETERQSANQEYHDAETAERLAQKAYEESRKRHEQAQAEATSAGNMIADFRRRLLEVDTRIDTLEETHGTKEARSQMLLDCQTQKVEAEQRKALLEGELANLQPHAVRSDIQRLGTAITTLAIDQFAGDSNFHAA